MVSVLRDHQEVYDGLASLKIPLDAMFATDIPTDLTKPFGVWYHYLCVLFLVCLFLGNSPPLFLGEIHHERYTPSTPILGNSP